mgnify:CR=1 FL=1
MARYTGPNNKQARRVGFSILENGKDLKRPYGPGQHGKDRKRKPSNYAVQLNEKQKVRFMYGISEKQFARLVNESGKMKGVHGENLLILLESRLDNIVYRTGFASTRRGSRQLVNHGHITVNGKKVDIPSYRVKPGDVVEFFGPNTEVFTFTIPDEIRNEKDEVIEVANHPRMIIKFKCDHDLEEFDMMRIKVFDISDFL